MFDYYFFLNPLKKGTILQSERGVNSILIHLAEKIELFA